MRRNFTHCYKFSAISSFVSELSLDKSFRENIQWANIWKHRMSNLNTILWTTSAGFREAVNQLLERKNLLLFEGNVVHELDGSPIKKKMGTNHFSSPSEPHNETNVLMSEIKGKGKVVLVLN
jgi:hypothetical protein